MTVGVSSTQTRRMKRQTDLKTYGDSLGRGYRSMQVAPPQARIGRYLVIGRQGGGWGVDRYNGFQAC